MTLHRLIDQPSPFSPRAELESFVAKYQSDQDWMVKQMVKEVRGHLKDSWYQEMDANRDLLNRDPASLNPDEKRKLAQVRQSLTEKLKKDR